MKIDAMKFGLATTMVVAVVWSICSLFVFSMPTGMMHMSGYMMHTNFDQTVWMLGWAGFIYGLVAWSLMAGVIAWAIVTVYNRLIG